MSSPINKMNLKVSNYEYFTTMYGSKITDISYELDNIEKNMGVSILNKRNIFSKYTLEDFIFDNIIVKNPNNINSNEIDNDIIVL